MWASGARLVFDKGRPVPGCTVAPGGSVTYAVTTPHGTARCLSTWLLSSRASSAIGATSVSGLLLRACAPCPYFRILVPVLCRAETGRQADVKLCAVHLQADWFETA